MAIVFADTSYWIALLNHRDRLHPEAAARSREYSREEMVTSELVLIELLNGLCGGGNVLRKSAATLTAGIFSGPMKVVPLPSHVEFQQILNRYSKMDDKEWSFTDCASFIIMESQGIRDALTHDRHFEQAGFRALMR